MSKGLGGLKENIYAKKSQVDGSTQRRYTYS